jgi:Zn-dependent protease
MLCRCNFGGLLVCGRRKLKRYWKGNAAMNVFGFPLRIEPFFFILVLLLGRSEFAQPERLFVIFAVVFVSVLIHELGHAFVSRYFGMQPSIALTGTGGVTYWQEALPLSPPRHIAISLAGPFAGFLLAAFVYVMHNVVQYWPAGSLADYFYRWLLFANIGWGILNLLPVIPLDGGHVVQKIEEWITGRPDGKVALGISVAVGLAVVGWGLMNGDMWIVVLMGFMLFNNASALFGNNR